MDAEIQKRRKAVSEQMDLCQDNEMKERLVARILEAEETGVNTIAFYEEIYFELVPNDGSN